MAVVVSDLRWLQWGSVISVMEKVGADGMSKRWRLGLVYSWKGATEVAIRQKKRLLLLHTTEDIPRINIIESDTKHKHKHLLTKKPRTSSRNSS
jgi:hypothetical protein